MENKVQLCGKYSTVMQIIVTDVKFLPVTTVTILNQGSSYSFITGIDTYICYVKLAMYICVTICI